MIILVFIVHNAGPSTIDTDTLSEVNMALFPCVQPEIAFNIQWMDGWMDELPPSKSRGVSIGRSWLLA